VAAVVAFFPPIEFTIEKPRPGFSPAAELLGESATAEAAQKASPINFSRNVFFGHHAGEDILANFPFFALLSEMRYLYRELSCSQMLPSAHP
jgi:hypothetical protein